MAAADELHGLRNQFYLGAFQQVINDATNPAVTPKSDSAKMERKVFLQRAYIAQGRYNMPLNEIKPSDGPELQAVRLLATYLSNPSARADVISQTQGLVSGIVTSPLLAIVTGSIFYHEELTDDTLRVLSFFPKNLECLALKIQTLLKMNRTDLAKKEVTSLKTWADDATLAQLIEAWCNIFCDGDEKYNEAFYTFDELVISNTATPKLLTGKAVCKIHAGKFDEAEALLMEALNRNSTDSETLVNLIVCAQATGKGSELVDRYLMQLRESAPQHPFLQELTLKEAMFDRCAQRFSI